MITVSESLWLAMIREIAVQRALVEQFKAIAVEATAVAKRSEELTKRSTDLVAKALKR